MNIKITISDDGNDDSCKIHGCVESEVGLLELNESGWNGLVSIFSLIVRIHFAQGHCNVLLHGKEYEVLLCKSLCHNEPYT